MHSKTDIYRGDDLLQAATDRELLRLSARSNTVMRRQIEQELDRRASANCPMRLNGIQAMGVSLAA